MNARIDRPVVRRPGQNGVVFGLRGSGKTFRVRQLIQQHPRVLIVDTQREYGAAAVEVSSLDQLADYLEKTSGRWRVAYWNTRLELDFDRLCRAAWSIGNLLFVIEEVDRFCEPGWIPDPLRDIVHYGRHAPGGAEAGSRPVDYLAVSRTPADVDRAITRQAYEIYCFTISEPRDVEYLGKYVGRDFAAGLSGLPPRHYRFMDLYDRRRGWRDVGPSDGGPVTADLQDVADNHQADADQPEVEADGADPAGG